MVRKIKSENKSRYDELLDMKLANEAPIFDEARYNEIISGLDAALENMRKTLAEFELRKTELETPKPKTRLKRKRT